MKKVFILVGPAGTGKTTAQEYLQQTFNFARVVTHTTRPPRAGEVNGIDYYFETPASFSHLDLLEHVEYDHKAYGSSMQGLERGWAKHPAAVMVLESQGAQTYRQRLGDQAVVIYLTVSKVDELVTRLTKRGDDQASIQSRITSREFQRDLTLPAALKDIAHVIVNDDWDETKQQLTALVQAELGDELND
ncbi:guanylate kinase [Limosilactobacillus equigenerosi]|uniref:Guanylate kinase n=1 Tax=Limosilactobacillus equigenerosi DSM 18793 = JCM 14505 TaxID=1423742 RepID=A0A0R1UQD2_9LACO|nr:AAA family ATPase [Limosilactobacillus equigenerosi]KRL95028.1 Guanylate kinase [Limosilactobacillus equigenerosi DSM 18793 = JCM 14505]